MKSPRKIVLLMLLLMPITSLADSGETVVSRIKREPVVSSNVATVGYSRRLHALEIEFVRGAIYRFLDVPPQLYRDFLASDSKGHFIAEHLRGRYRFIRVRPRLTGKSQAHRLQRKTAALPP